MRLRNYVILYAEAEDNIELNKHSARRNFNPNNLILSFFSRTFTLCCSISYRWLWLYTYVRTCMSAKCQVRIFLIHIHVAYSSFDLIVFVWAAKNRIIWIIIIRAMQNKIWWSALFTSTVCEYTYYVLWSVRTRAVFCEYSSRSESRYWNRTYSPTTIC